MAATLVLRGGPASAREQRLIGRAINSENIDFRATIDALMKDRAYRKKFEILR
jgi:hypothetical protein